MASGHPAVLWLGEGWRNLFSGICTMGVFYTGERNILHGLGALREGAGVFLLSENQSHCKDFWKMGHLAPNSQGAVMEWRWCSVAVRSLEIFPFHYADIRDWQELILMGAMCEIHSKCCCFLAALGVLTICCAAQRSPGAASRWLGFSAWHWRCHNSLLCRGGGRGKKTCQCEGSPGLNHIGKSVGVRDKTQGLIGISQPSKPGLLQPLELTTLSVHCVMMPQQERQSK